MTRKRLLPVLALVAALAVAAALLLARPPGGTVTAGPDPNAAPAPTRGPTQAELQAQLQAQTEESSFRFKVSGAPAYFPEDGDWGLNIGNSIENSQSMYVVVTLEETGEELYRSATLPPGGQVLRDKLSAALPPGEHKAVATAYILDTEGEAAGAIEAELTLTVEP